jgi:hypothetical protein
MSLSSFAKYNNSLVISRAVTISILLVAVAVFSTIALAQVSPASSSVGREPAVHSPTSSAHFSEVSAFDQYVSYWTTEPGWHTELQLRNNLESGQLIVTPAVRMPDGTETALPPVSIESGDVVSIDLHDALTKTAPQLVGGWGSVVLRYHAVVFHALYAAVMVRAVGHSVAFHLDGFIPSPNYQTGSREGIWWVPTQPVTDYLILTNTGDQKLDSSFVLYDAGGKGWQQKLSLSARETRRVSMAALVQQAGLTGSYGGIRMDVAEGAGYLDSAHLLFDELSGFSAEMKMFRHDPSSTLSSRSFGGVKEWTTRAPMLALSNPDPALGFPEGATLQPKVFVRNATGKSYTAHMRFNWRSATASGKSAPLDLAFKPYETKVVDVAALQAQKLLPADAPWVAVVLSAPVQPDELLAVASSYDQTGRYGAQTPFSDQLASHWEAGKWEVDSMHDSLVTVGNGGIKPERAQLTILYNQGKDQYQVERMLAPDEQMALDFGKLIRDQVPDKDGHTLPPDLSSGTYRIRDLSDTAAGGLYEGKLTLDKTYGHAAYGCAICCGLNVAFMYYDPLDVLASSNGDQIVQAGDSCGGGTQTVTGDFPTWGTDNTAIATASKAVIHGVAPGTTNHYATSVPMYWGLKEYYPTCPTMQRTATAPTNVAPTVTISGSGYIAMLKSGSQGSDSTTLTATGNPSGGTYSWAAVSGQGNITILNATSQSATIQSVAVGTFTVQVTYTVNSQPGTATAVGKVQQPGSLGVISNDTELFGCTNLGPPGSYNTEERLILYQVLDTSTPPAPIQVSDMSATETLNGGTNTCRVPDPNPTVGAQTGSNGYFPAPDTLRMCSPACLPANGSGNPTGSCSLTFGQTWTVNGYPVKSDTVAFTCAGPPTGAP